MNKLSLSLRLKKIYDIIPNCNSFADIGTDHAYLPVYMCLTDKCNSAIASDIVPGPLERAKSTVAKYDMCDRISLRLGPGVSTLSQGEADVISIAGMGGLVIANILQDGHNVVTSAKSVLLQPMTAVSDLRKYLYSNSWKITEEHLVKENNKLYNILAVAYDASLGAVEADDLDIFVGRYLIDNKPNLYNEYLQRKIFKLNKKIDGLKKSSDVGSASEIEENQRLLKKIQELLEEYDNV